MLGQIIGGLANGILGSGGVGGFLKKGWDWFTGLFRKQKNIYKRPENKAPLAITGGPSSDPAANQQLMPANASQQSMMQKGAAVSDQQEQGQWSLNNTGQMIAPWLASGLSWGARKIYDTALRPFGEKVSNVQMNQVMPYVPPGGSVAITYKNGLDSINQYNRGGYGAPAAAPKSNVQRYSSADELD